MNRLIASIKFVAPSIDHAFFNAIWISRGIPPLPHLFQENSIGGGGGVYIFGLLSAPFIWLCGEGYFSLKVTNIVINILIYITMWKFCVRYLNVRIAVFSSLLFVFIPGLITEFLVFAFGRHFELNLFFLIGLFLLCNSIEKKKIYQYLMVGLLCGGGVYFYPGFLFTSSIIGLFLWATVKHKWTIVGYEHIWFIACIMIAIENLDPMRTWLDLRDMLSGLLHFIVNVDSAGEMTIVDYLYGIMHRLFLLVTNLPNVFVHHIKFTIYAMDSEILSTVLRLIFSISFYTGIIVLIWVNRTHLKKVIINICSFTNKNTLTAKEYAVSFLLIHFIFYIIAYGIVGYIEIPIPWVYHLVILLNMILLIALFLDKMWTTINKKVAIGVLMCVLCPGIIFHGLLYAKGDTSSLYKQYLCFYIDHELFQVIKYQKNKSIQKKMCALFSPNFSNTMGQTYIKEPCENIEDDFNFLAGEDEEKHAQLYHGYIMRVYDYFAGDMRQIISRIKAIDKQYWQFCYTGLGERSMDFQGYDLYYPHNPQHFEKLLVTLKPFIPQSHKKYFIQGVGIGVAKKILSISEQGFYDNEIFNEYVARIDKKYRKDFIKGFSLVQNWNKI